ncbi:MAG: ABC transporter substrate-binding protein [Thermoprotei archaeon]|nr:MAG: ABC transporter substrate-binding protein [Thermoprotei archaeon]
MKIKKSGIVLILLLLFAVVTPLIGSLQAVHAQLPIPPGVPRGDVLIVHNDHGTYPDPTNFNWLVPGVFHAAAGGSGYNQLCAGILYYLNTTNSEIISWLAAGLPEYSPDYKTVKIRVVKGAYWNDGTPFTADDVVFTINYLLEAPGGIGSVIKRLVSRAYKVDDYTLVVELKIPNPRFHYIFTAIIYQPPIKILPKHQWEGKDPLKFKAFPPVCIGPYNLKAYDPGGNWFLWERYEDWWATKLYGIKPSPKYVLYIHYGTEEAYALAMVKHELDAKKTFLPEYLEIVLKGNPYVGGWRAKPPLAWPFDARIKGLAFNVLRYPYNITEVRRALVHLINFTEVWLAFKGPEGSLPIPSPLPVVRTPAAEKVYYIPLKEELLKLGLDPNPPKVIRDYLKELGYDPDIVWYKYDPEEAERLLKKVGFYRGSDGKWYLPNGTKWVINILAPGAYEAEPQRMAFIVADQWRRFGIEVNVLVVESGVFYSSWSKGTFEIGAFWPGGIGPLLDYGALPYAANTQWNSRYFNPDAPSVGWAAYNFTGKYGSKKDLDEILNELEATPPTETDKIYSQARKALLIWAEQQPWIGFFPAPFYTVNDRYCWEGWPSYPDNYYMDPVYWWAQMLFIVLKLRPTGRCPVKEAVVSPPSPTMPTSTPSPSPTPTPPLTPSPAATVTVTQTIEKTVPTTVLSTIMRTITTAIREIDWTPTIALAVVLFIVGLAVGRFTVRKR